MHQYFAVAVGFGIFLMATLYFVDDTRWEAVIEKYHVCMQRHPKLRTPDSTWADGSGQAVRDCYKFGPNIISVENQDEAKRLIVMNNPRENCTFVTLGIGKDAMAEAKVKAMMPNCKFYGADPVLEENKVVYENVKIFGLLIILEKVGEYHQLAISGNNIADSSILTKSGYQTRKKMPAMPMYQFFAEIVKSKTIDYLFVDIEYAEYDLFDYLQAGKALENGYTICQINLEAHIAQNIEQKVKYMEFIRKLVNEGHYALAYDDNTIGHHRIFFYNHRAPACRRKFMPFS
ncbi:unnamed protein product, partial [Mesorhabditis spiculigera]